MIRTLAMALVLLVSGCTLGPSPVPAAQQHAPLGPQLAEAFGDVLWQDLSPSGRDGACFAIESGGTGFLTRALQADVAIADDQAAEVFAYIGREKC